MSVNYNPSIVTSGLVLYLDVANPRSYPGTGSTWYDLSGNGNNLTLYNSPTFSTTKNGILTFNGTNQYAGISNALCSSNFKTMASGYTTIIGFKSNQVDAAWHNVYGFGDGVNFIDAWYQQNTGYFGSDAQGHYSSLTPLISAGYVIYSHSFSGTTSKLYNNGTPVSVLSTTSGALTAGAYGFNIAATADGLLYYHNMDISFLMVYNVVLTDDQVQQNSTALRGRYGI
jgi:hypothetical protein